MKNTWYKSFFLLGLGFIQYAVADTAVFKCIENGKTIFSQVPCKGVLSTPVDIKTTAPTPADQLEAKKTYQRTLKEMRQLEKSRHQAESQQAAIDRQLSNKAAARNKRCEAQQMKSKWAKEDVKNSQPRNEMKAQQKLKRAQEKAEFVCKN
ncbi:hypothetical protein [Undibacterium fentianense]|uniref:DUF4124 domain-containing protein n=1 Tax=Undibacterium fentianense TaxID=2828728 RepID=A0A941DWN4_9BURK|nr:hypothetical protein [Undibacterium fentianense]MBR7798714.1 hypothetical protein [Undibacterium fentianense]